MVQKNGKNKTFNENQNKISKKICPKKLKKIFKKKI